MKDYKLLPCPFCHKSPCKNIQRISVSRAVWCNNCGAHGPELGTEAEAVDAWNKRHKDDLEQKAKAAWRYNTRIELEDQKAILEKALLLLSNESKGDV